jgi:hypothetical protein
MKFPCSVVFFSAILLALLVDCNTGTPHRRVPFNGSMYGKRTAGALPMGTYTRSLHLRPSFYEFAHILYTKWAENGVVLIQNLLAKKY